MMISKEATATLQEIVQEWDLSCSNCISEDSGLLAAWNDGPHKNHLLRVQKVLKTKLKEGNWVCCEDDNTIHTFIPQVFHRLEWGTQVSRDPIQTHWERTKAVSRIHIRQWNIEHPSIAKEKLQQTADEYCLKFCTLFVIFTSPWLWTKAK